MSEDDLVVWGKVVAGVVAALLCVALMGCASVGAPAAMTERFDPAAAAFINAQGKASVSGQAFVRQDDGKLLRAVGTNVYLNPRTPYADERVAAIYGTGDKQKWGARVPDADPLYEKSMRKTVASSSGSFRFDHLADGNYYVVAMIFQPGGLAFEFPILERITVKGGQSVRIVMRGY